MHLPEKVLMDKLGRSRSSITMMKTLIRRNGSRYARDYQNRDFDTRPSGWYGEVIGTLLLGYADAYDTWKHYHRYVEVKVIGEDKLGWTTLLCRREADAP